MSINGISGHPLDYTPTASSHVVNAANAKRAHASSVFEEGMTLDEVSISDEVRALWEQNIKDRAAYAEKTGGDIYKEIDFTQEDLSEIKEAFRSLKQARDGIDKDIDGILKKSGIKLAANDKLKIEFDGNGKVIVGGVSDAETAKAIEKALNGDKDFVEKFRVYRNQEQSVSSDLKETTGMSLEDYRNRLSTVQNGDLDGKVFKTNAGETYTNDELVSFKDQELNWVDSEFMGEISEYIQTDSQYDIAPGNDILADPAATMNKAVKDIRDNVMKSFQFENEKLRSQFDESNPEDKILLDKMMMSLDNVKIQIDANGGVVIEGNISEDERMNQLGKSLIEGFARDMLRGNPVTGEKSEYAIAAERLMNLYEDEYGEASSGENAVSTIANGKVGSQVYSPEKKNELQSEIQKGVNEAVEKMGGVLEEELEIAIDEDGKISVANLPADEKNRKITLDILKQLNSGMDSGGGSMKDILSVIASKMEQFGVLSEGGSSKINKFYSYAKEAS